ncbi:MAG TPA: DotI/IcmL family type IV secretion protein [Gammaproteobacteria bacterium]|nr:DotI/IcmL family type IV secretion protein [Gammaproteobacteria bacterium]
MNRLLTSVITLTHKSVMGLSLIILMLFIACFSYYGSFENQKSYGVALDGTVIDINYLRAPIKSTEDVMQWAAMVSSKALSLNFSQYEEQMSQLRPYFTENGWQKYSEALTTSGYLDQVKKKRLYVTAINNKSPMIPKWGYINNGSEFYWKAQVPLILSIQTASETKKKNRMVTLLIKLKDPVIPNDNGCGYRKVWTYMKENLSIADMYKKGCRVRAFRAAGLTDDQLSAAGFSAKMLNVDGNGLNPMVVDSFISK